MPTKSSACRLTDPLGGITSSGELLLMGMHNWRPFIAAALLRIGAVRTQKKICISGRSRCFVQCLAILFRAGASAL